MISSRKVAVGDDTDLEIATIQRGRQRPRVAVLGGVHGDELEGVLAVGRLLHRLRDEPLQGRLDLVRIANPAAYAAQSRATPQDGRNLAREFPGDQRGTLTQRLAHALTQGVISGADLLIDLHSAGAHYQMPVFVGYCNSGPSATAAECAARAFGAPIIWRHPVIGPGRSLSAASALGIASIYVEGSGGGGLREADLDIYEGGVLRVLRMLAMLDDKYKAPAGPAEPEMLDGGDGDVDASLTCSASGLCVTCCQVSDEVASGQVIARIVAPDGRPLEELRSSRRGRVMMLRRTAEVTAGDGIAMLGPPARGAETG